MSTEVTQLPTAEQPWPRAYSQVTIDANGVADEGQSLVVLQVLGCGPPSTAPELAPDVTPLAEPDPPVGEAPDPDVVDPVAAAPADALRPDDPAVAPDVAVPLPVAEPLVPPSGPSPACRLLLPQATVSTTAAENAAY